MSCWQRSCYSGGCGEDAAAEDDRQVVLSSTNPASLVEAGVDRHALNDLVARAVIDRSELRRQARARPRDVALRCGSGMIRILLRCRLEAAAGQGVVVTRVADDALVGPAEVERDRPHGAAPTAASALGRDDVGRRNGERRPRAVRLALYGGHE